MKLIKLRRVLIITLAGMRWTAVSAHRPAMTIRVLDQANLSANKIQKMEHYVEDHSRFNRN